MTRSLPGPATLEPFADLASALPNPFVSVQLDSTSTDQSVRWVRHHQRRSEIFAEARYLLAKMGPERFSLRRLAGRCELTTQSIYNLVGNRSQVISAAIRDHADSVLEAALRLAKDQFGILAVEELYLAMAREFPDFMSSSIRVMFGSEPDLRRELFTHGWKMRERCLASMQIEGKIVSDADCAFVAQQLTLNGCASAHEWFMELCDNEEHRKRHLWGAATLLYRFLTDAERAKLEPLLDTCGKLDLPDHGDPEVPSVILGRLQTH